MKKLLSILCAVFVLALASYAQSARLKAFGEMSWVGGEQVFSNTLQVNTGDWVEYRIQCNTGDYIKSCGLPEYFNEATGQHIKFQCLPPWTIGPTTEQVCGLASPIDGTFPVLVPVLYKGIVYSGTYEVTAGPTN
jgi:hypothetical protein